MSESVVETLSSPTMVRRSAQQAWRFRSDRSWSGFVVVSRGTVEAVGSGLRVMEPK